MCREQLRHSLTLRTQSKAVLEEMRLELAHLTRQIAAGRSPSPDAQEASDTAGTASRLACCTCCPQKRACGCTAAIAAFIQHGCLTVHVPIAMACYRCPMLALPPGCTTDPICLIKGR